MFRREGEEGGTGTVLVFNSLLYPSTPVKEVDNGYLLITLPETESKLTSYLLKAVDETKTKKVDGGLRTHHPSIVICFFFCICFSNNVLFIPLHNGKLSVNTHLTLPRELKTNKLVYPFYSMPIAINRIDSIDTVGEYTLRESPCLDLSLGSLERDGL